MKRMWIILVAIIVTIAAVGMLVFQPRSASRSDQGTRSKFAAAVASNQARFCDLALREAIRVSPVAAKELQGSVFDSVLDLYSPSDRAACSYRGDSEKRVLIMFEVVCQDPENPACVKPSSVGIFHRGDLKAWTSEDAARERDARRADGVTIQRMAEP
jgi:hypothetical protein